MKTRLATRIATACSACCITGWVARAQDAVCNVPPPIESPAAGGWSGQFMTSYEVLNPHLPPTVKVVGTWQGTLEFALLRPQQQENPPTLPPAPPPNRQPLRPPGTPAPASAPSPDRARPGQFASPDEQRAAIMAALEKRWEEEDGMAREKASRFGTSTTHAGEIKGETRSSERSSVSGTTEGVRVEAQSETRQDLEFDLMAVESDPIAGFREILVVNTHSQGDFSGTSVATGPGGRATVEALGGDSSGTQRVLVEADDGIRAEGFTSTDPVTIRPGVVATFAIAESTCGLMRGPVDASYVREVTQQGGADLRIQESEWIATHDNRDEAFEQRVERLVNEPIPAEMTWEFAERYAREFEALSAEAGVNPYKRCLLVRARHKGLQITVAALQTLKRNLPRVGDGATRAVLSEWRLRTLPLIRTLQLNAVDCALIKQVDDEYYAEMRKLLEQVLARKHTLEELLAFAGLWRAGELGDLELAFFGE